MVEIICKWWSDKLNIGVTEDKRVFTLINNKPVQLIKEFHMMRTHYRIPGTSRRISDLTINKNISIQHKVIQQYCPF
ncbi:MAG: hypothetical protein GX879_11160 [Bacteroidales bacterium]|nr:hypothetical protein [Bacteroidales bacterium]